MAVEDHASGSDLPQRLVRTIEDWGKTVKGQDPGQLTDLAVDALLKTTAMICLYRELSRAGLSPEVVQACYRTLLKEEPVAAETDDLVLKWRARRDLFLRDLRKSLKNW
jgi:hypothetical protein